jgi:hypothetical protein
MEKISLVGFLMWFYWSTCFAQETMPNFDRNLLISADLAFTPSKIFNESITQYYIHGSLNVYLHPRVSIRGDSAFSFREYFDNDISLRYHSVFFGGCYHFMSNGVYDPYIGFQPGISLFDRSNFDGQPIDSKMELIPNASFILGFLLFIHKYFNFYTNVRYVYGQPSLNPTIGSGLHEIRFAFGLGLNYSRNTKSK